MTFGEVDRAANGTAGALRTAGVGRGDRVAWWGGTTLDAVPLFAAVPDPELDVLPQFLAEETEDGPTRLTFQRLAVDADDEVVPLQTSRLNIETGRRPGDPAQGVQVHAEKGNFS